jgi:two-component system cell cycle sensor histidine kinase/response regulator CckA
MRRRQASKAEVPMTDSAGRRPDPRRIKHSIRRQLALVIAGLVLAVIGIFSAAAYRQVRGSAISSASQRLESVAGQLRDAVVASVKSIRTQAATVAADSAVRSFFAHQDPATTERARLAATRITSASRATLAGVELWDASGRRLLSTSDTLPAIAGEGASGLLDLVSGADSTAIGWITNQRGALRYTVLARVTDGPTTLGYVVERRLLTGSPQATRQLSELIGGDARSLVGNTRGDIWTDFNAIAAAPPVDLRASKGVVEYARGDTAAVLAAVSPIAGTPWTFAVEFPRARVLSSAHAMLWQLGIVALVLLLAAGMGAVVLSASVTRPLGDLVGAAEAISTGDYSRRVRSVSNNELGALGAAFNRMADSVQEAQRDSAVKMVALEGSELRYRDLFESNPHPMWVYDVETRCFLAVNDAAVRRYGFSRDEFLRMSILDIRPPEEVPKLLGNLDQIHSSGVNGEVWRHRTKDGTLIDVEVSSQSIAFDNRPARLVHAHDLTERRRAEESLRATQERLQRVIASSGAVIFELRLQEQNVELDWISENVQAILGYDVAEAHAAHWWSAHVHPDDRRRFPDRPSSGAYRDGSAEYRFRHRDGRYRWLREEQRVLHDATGRPATVIGAWLDITEWRQLEEQFHQSQKMEAIGQLAGGVAHDFNNLLTVILAEADLVLGSASFTDRSHRMSLEEIRKSGDRAASLTRQLLTFSRRQLIEPTVVNLNEIVGAVDNMLRRLIGEAIRVDLKLESRVGETVADRGQIEQVFVNLVVNARDAMPRGGTLTIETGSVHLDEAYAQSHANVTSGDYVMLAVSDTGTGMTEQVQSHLFEPFFTTKEPGKGTGLGLATCFAIARQFGGHIGVYSEVGVGTTMRVYLPKTSKPGGSAGSADRPAMLGGHETILLVEDEPQVRRVASRMLTNLGYTVHETADGEEAIHFLEGSAGEVDLLFTDVVLPGMGGRALADRVAQLCPGTRVLFSSGYSDDVMLHHQLLEGEATLLQKPFTMNSLAEKVREVLDQPAPAGV